MKKKNQTFREYYDSLSVGKRAMLRDKIIRECGISPFTFYPKMSGRRSWGKLERRMIAELLKKPVTHLFPEIKTEKKVEY